MQQYIQFSPAFQINLNPDEMHFHPPSFKQLFNSFYIFYINSDGSLFDDFNPKAVKSIKLTRRSANKCMFVHQLKYQNINFYSVCIDYKIFIIEEQYYQPFLTTLEKACCFSQSSFQVVDLTKETTQLNRNHHDILNDEYQFEHIHTEIDNFLKSFTVESNLWFMINQVLVGFLIYKAYQHRVYRRCTNFLNNGNTKHVFLESDLIFLRSLKKNNRTNELSQVDLYYYLPNQTIYVIKSYNPNNASSKEKYENEKAFYELQKNIVFEAFPKYYGHATFTYEKPNLIIEFIRGPTLLDILSELDSCDQLSIIIKLHIIISVLISFEDLHLSGFIYRDFKLDNIIISFTTSFQCCAYLIDFDNCKKLNSKASEAIVGHNKRYSFKEEFDSSNEKCTIFRIDHETNITTIIKTISIYDVIYNDSQPDTEIPIQTNNIGHDIQFNQFTAPEQRNSSIFSYSTDIYSVGKFLYYLCSSKVPDDYSEHDFQFPPEFSFLQKLYNHCTRDNPARRPNISRVINSFISALNRTDQTPIIQKAIYTLQKKFAFVIYNRLGSIQIISNSKNIGFTYDNYVLNMAYSMLKFLFYPHVYIGEMRKQRVKAFLNILKSICQPLISESEYFHFEKHALNGKSLMFLATLLIDGRIVEPNTILAHVFLLEAALQNDPHALLAMIVPNWFNLFRPPLDELQFPISILEKASIRCPDRCSVMLDLFRAQYLINNGDELKGIALMTKIADEKNFSYMHHFAGIYYIEHHIDIQKGIDYLKRASFGLAYYHLSLIYASDLFVPQDSTMSQYYLQLAADDEFPAALYFLSQYLLFEKSTSKALDYLLRASLSEKYTSLRFSEYLQSFASFLLFCLYTARIFPQRQYEKSIQFLQRSIDLENPLALMIYTQLTESNKYLEPDLRSCIASIPLGCESLRYYLNLIECYSKIHGFEEHLRDFTSILVKWYLTTVVFDGNFDESLAYCQILLSYERDFIQEMLLNSLIETGKSGNRNALFLIYYTYCNNPKTFIYLKHLFTSVADENDPTAQFLLGKHLISQGEYNDVVRGIEYLEKAAANKSNEALYLLGKYYMSGEMVEYGIPEDHLFGIKLYESAAANGCPESQIALINTLLDSNELHSAISYAKESISQGNISAYYPLGICYLKMMHYPGDLFCEKGIKCLQQGSQHSSYECKTLLAMIYHEGILTVKDEFKAYHLYQDLVNRDYIKYVYNNIGVMLKNGSECVNQDILLAIEYFEEAIKMEKDIFAIFNLSKMYFYGQGIPVDVGQASSKLKQLNLLKFDINNILDYIEKHQTRLNQSENERLDDRDMNDILPKQYRDLFPPNCFRALDFIYSIDQYSIIIPTEELKQLYSVTNQFYEGLL